MKAAVRSKTGAKKSDITLPEQFSEQVRPDLIKRAVLVVQNNRRQPYGTDPDAGKKYSSKLSRRRRDYKGAYGMGISRVPRKIMSHRGTRFNWMGAAAPNTVGGMQPHPPKAEKVLSRKINKKERRKAIRSALAASVVKELVEKRGHIVADYPLVLEDDIESISKTKEVLDLFAKLGLEKELERASRKSQKTGRAKRRGRTHKKAKGPLVVVSEKCELQRAASNIPGVDVCLVRSLNAELLAPGTDIGRLTIYTKKSIDLISEEKLFTDEVKIAIKEKSESNAAKKAKAGKKKTEKSPAAKKKTAKKKKTKTAAKPKKETAKKKKAEKKPTKKADKK